MPTSAGAGILNSCHEAQDGDQNLGVQLAALERAPVKVGQEA